MIDKALLNWVQMKTVADARPDDDAAKQTLQFFEQVLKEDHQLENFFIAEVEDSKVHIQYSKDGTSHKLMYDRMFVEQLLVDINANPKYNE